jgi:hypothetical protein
MSEVIRISTRAKEWLLKVGEPYPGCTMEMIVDQLIFGDVKLPNREMN